MSAAAARAGKRARHCAPVTGNNNCCYLLASLRSAAATYVGYTRHPARRLRQHNGEIKAGARRTRLQRPWRMVAVVSGFPTQTAALQFEWAWQHPKRSRFLRASPLVVRRGVSGKLAILTRMLATPPFVLWPLALHVLDDPIRALLASAKAPRLPGHVEVTVGPIETMAMYRVDAGGMDPVAEGDGSDADDDSDGGGGGDDGDGGDRRSQTCGASAAGRRVRHGGAAVPGEGGGGIAGGAAAAVAAVAAALHGDGDDNNDDDDDDDEISLLDMDDDERDDGVLVVSDSEEEDAGGGGGDDGSEDAASTPGATRTRAANIINVASAPSYSSCALCCTPAGALDSPRAAPPARFTCPACGASFHVCCLAQHMLLRAGAGASRAAAPCRLVPYEPCPCPGPGLGARPAQRAGCSAVLWWPSVVRAVRASKPDLHAVAAVASILAPPT